MRACVQDRPQLNRRQPASERAPVLPASPTRQRTTCPRSCPCRMPGHGIEPGPKAPEVVTAYVEITPFDTVKYEVDKTNGYLRVDRPQRGTSSPPTLYGFVPRTYCAARVAAMGDPVAQRGDGDPLD